MNALYSRTALTVAIACAIVVGLSLMIASAVRGAPEGRLVLAVGGTAGQYQGLAEAYQKELVGYGVDLQLRPSVEGFPALKSLVDPKSGIDAAFIKGGIVGSLQGRLAGTKAREWQDRELGKLRSVGRLFYEPIWVFTRNDTTVKTLHDLKDKKVLIGTRESGTRRVAGVLLRANGITVRDNPLMIEDDLEATGKELISKEADAAVLILPSDSDTIQQLLRNPALKLMDFSTEADAYTNRFPALSAVTLRRGAVEFEPLTPAGDIVLLSTTAALVVRANLDPALISLLTNAVINNPRSGFDKAGDPVLFYKAGEFPNGSDPEFEVAEASRQVYKAGDLPFVLRVLAPMAHKMGLPFEFAALANAHGAQTILLLIPSLAILLPLMRFVPMLYNWTMRRRLLYWYRQLKGLELQLDNSAAGDDRSPLVAELDRIDAGVRRIKVPLHFSDQFYDLRGHIDLVRQRLTRPSVVRMAAE